jgi:hypothetical protein
MEHQSFSGCATRRSQGVGGLDCAHDFKTCADRNLLRSRLSLRWTSNFRATLDTALVSASAVYDQATNTMIVFGGIDAIGLAFGDTNAVLLYAPATGDGLWSTLIANGTAGFSGGA